MCGEGWDGVGGVEWGGMGWDGVRGVGWGEIIKGT